MRINNPATLLNTEFDTLFSSVAGFFVSTDFGVVHAVQRSVPIQNLAKSRPNFTGRVLYQKVITGRTQKVFHSMRIKRTR